MKNHQQPEYAKIVSDQRILLSNNETVVRRSKFYKVNIDSLGIQMRISPPNRLEDAWMDVKTPVSYDNNTPVVNSWELRVQSSPAEALPSLDAPNYDYTNCPGRYFFNPHTVDSVRISLRDISSCSISVLANGNPIAANVIITSPCVLIF